MAKSQEAKPDAATAQPGTAADDGSAASPPSAVDGAPEATNPDDTSSPSEIAAEPALPMVEAPKVDADERIVPAGFAPVIDAPGQTAGESLVRGAAPAASAHASRFLPLAACVAIAAALGSFVGSLSTSGVTHLWPGSRRAETAMVAVPAVPATKPQLAELSALKTNLDLASRSANSQFAKISDRLDRVERAQIEPATKIARIADAVDRLEKRGVAAPETTGSIAGGEGSASDVKPSDRVLPDWVVQDVRGGRALVESRFGGVFAVATGNVIPGLGRVEAVKRQDGEWVVVTAHGLITSSGR